MRKQLPADLFLIGVRQARNLRDGLFESSDHVPKLAHSHAFEGRKLERAKGIEPSYAAWEAYKIFDTCYSKAFS